MKGSGKIMSENHLRKILTEVAQGSRGVDDAFKILRDLPYEDLDFARLDHHRSIRKGIPEVIYGQGKTPEQVAAIVDRFMVHDGRALATRVTPEIVAAVKESYPQAVHYEAARILAVGEFPPVQSDGYVAVVTAGTSDIPVAEEAAVTLELLGSKPVRIYDVGVAGLHRLLDKREVLSNAGAVIAIAGMEGALASVVGGIVGCPVVAVPTSVGYGTSFNGLAALLSMLNSCALGIAVVNIDNGFGAAVYAHMIVKQKGTLISE